MPVQGDPVIHILLTFYGGIIEITSFLALTLLLIGYDIRQNIKKTIFLVVIFSTIMTTTFYLPQAIRTIFNFVLTFFAVKWYLAINARISFLTCFIFWLIAFSINTLLFIIMTTFVHISPYEYLESIKLRLVFPWFQFVITGFLIYISYKHNWRIPQEVNHFSLKVGLMAAPAFQLVVLFCIINEYAKLHLYLLNSVYMPISVAVLISFYILWKIIRFSGREARITAQEQLAREMQERVDVIRTQRHDFINHIMVLASLLHEDRRHDMIQYVENIKREINPPEKIRVFVEK